MGYECATKETDYWWWADALYMAMPVMSKMYVATGDVKYLDKMYDNFTYADNLMYDKEDNLYYRDGKYLYPAHKTEAGKKDFWARGNGWVLAGLAKVITDMPASYVNRGVFVERFKSLAAGAVKCQQPDGYWTRSMLDPKQAEGRETSGTALLAYGLMWGVNNGLLDRAVYGPAADRAWQYLSTVALQSDGSVGYVQPIGEKAIKGQLLSAQNVTNFGTGAFLLAACEKVRYDDGSVRPTDARTFTVGVTNSTDRFRQEVVELDAKEVFCASWHKRRTPVSVCTTLSVSKCRISLHTTARYLLMLLCALAERHSIPSARALRRHLSIHVTAVCIPSVWTILPGRTTVGHTDAMVRPCSVRVRMLSETTSGSRTLPILRWRSVII